jgi:hypothetical protein
MGIVLAAQMFGAKDLQSVLAENAHHDIAPHAFARSLTATKYKRNTGWRSGILKLPSSRASDVVLKCRVAVSKNLCNMALD